MRRVLLPAFILSSLFIPVAAVSQQQATSGIQFSGFIKMDAFFDTRQNITAREGHFLLFPAAKQIDQDGTDRNAASNFNILAIQTRLKGESTGPEAFGAKTHGIIEGAFFGNSESDINGFRLRHAYLKLKWTSTTVLFGQYWHPMFVTQAYPGVVSFNTGVPFQPFSRNAQIRVTRSFGSHLQLIGAALSQRDFTSPGGSASLRNAAAPNIHIQSQLSWENAAMGAGFDYKELRPDISIDEKVKGTSWFGFARLTRGSLQLKTLGVFGSNLYDHLMLGGYCKYIDGDRTRYAPMNSYAGWGEISYGGKNQIALFAGFTKSAFPDDDKPDEIYARGSNIDRVMRLSPRIIRHSGTVRMALELEYTSARYLSEIETEESSTVSNIRLLFASYMFF